VYQQKTKAKLDNAISQIKAVVQDPEVGTVFDGKVTKNFRLWCFC
jgi:Polyribonucleotide nucleotidyltransferase (polynucleotide phosphorylase)